jgi:hypothetical protein
MDINARGNVQYHLAIMGCSFFRRHADITNKYTGCYLLRIVRHLGVVVAGIVGPDVHTRILGFVHFLLVGCEV